MKRAIITGPTGSIGVALILKLLEEGYYVYAICRKDSKRITNIPAHEDVEIVPCDLSDIISAKDLIGDSCDVFYHLGWDGTTGSSRDDTYLQNLNVQYSMDAVKLAHETGCYTFIGVGSQAEYGRANVPLTPVSPTNPETGYGIAKLCAGQFTRLMCRKYGMKHIWARVFSVYGPYDSSNSMIISAISKMMHGEVVELTKGEQQWDYLYSSDAANALYLLTTKGLNGKTYCIGSGHTSPLTHYVETMREIINPNAEIQYGAIPYSEKQIMYLCADIKDLVDDTGFIPRVTFRDGILEIKEKYS